MQYNGLKDDLNALAKFVFIYETSIKFLTKDGEFSKKYPKAHHVFKHKLSKKIKFATTIEIANLSDFKKYTLYFTKHNVQVLDLCRHLRNSFGHGLLIYESNHLTISDFNKGRQSSKGHLDYSLLMNFIIEIIKRYEQECP